MYLILIIIEKEDSIILHNLRGIIYEKKRER